MRTLIIDNYLPNSPQVEHLYNIIKDTTVHTVEVKDYSSISVDEDFKFYNCFILSGSQRKLAEPGVFEYYANVVELIKNTSKPMLGICFGHQLIAMAFYTEVIPMENKIEGYYVVRKLVNNEIFDGLGEKFLVMKSHEEMVKNVPSDFILLADSPNCPIEAIKHQILPIYGLQFHPERFDDKHPVGAVILENFFKMVTWFM